MAFCGVDPSVGLHQWTKDRLIRAFNALMLQEEVPLKLCLFIDGLDESMDNPTELVELICQITSKSNLKCVISSRPWAIFSRMLEAYPQIRLHDFIYNDIHDFVAGSIEKASSEVPLTDTETHEIIASLVDKADGVFLWVSLVTAFILEGFRNGDDFDELQSRVSELFVGLKDLYGTILSRIDERYRIQSTRFFKILLLKYPNWCLEPSVLEPSFVDMGMSKKSQLLRG